MRRRHLAALAGWVAALSLCAAVAAGAAIKLPSAGSAKQVAALVKASSQITALSSKVAAQVAGSANDNMAVLDPTTKDGCPKLTSCVFGDTTSKKTFVVMGDSHAQMWMPAFNRIGKAKKLKVILLFLASCPAASVSVWTPAYGAYPACTAARSTWISDLDELQPLTIVLTDRTSGIFNAATDGSFTPSEWQAGMETTLRDLAPSHAHLVILGDIVAMDAAPAQCLAAYPTHVQTCSVPNPNPMHPGLQAAEMAAATAEHALYVNPIKWLCTTTCSEVIGSYIAYYDAYHLSCEYAAYLSGVLQSALKKVL